MNSTAVIVAALFASAIVACSAETAPVAADCVDQSTVSYASADERVALCLPAGFLRRSSGTSWTRGVATDSGFTYVVVAALDSAEQAKIDWPPQLLEVSTGALHERVCEGVTVRDIRIDDRPARLWSGTCTAPGMDRTPTITAGWALANGDVGFLVAWGSHERNLADVERALATVRIR